MIKLCKSVVVLLLLSNLWGCSSQPVQVKEQMNIELNDALFNTQNLTLLNRDDIFLLSANQQQEFLIDHQRRLALGTGAHEAVIDYMQQWLTHFSFENKTYIAQDIMRLKKGNCVSLAILTTALSQLVGLEYRHRVVTTLPVFEKKNNLVLSTSHVQVIINDPDFVAAEGRMYFSKPGVVIDYFPEANNLAGEYISYPTFLAMFYSNIAASALVDNDLDLAFANARKAYQIDPKNSAVLNFLALIHKRKGDMTTADKIYANARKYLEPNVALLSNYIVLLEANQNYGQANVIGRELDNLDDYNPYRWLAQAMIAENLHKYRSAEKKYYKVLDLAPYVSEAYRGLYHLYLAQGKQEKAKGILKQSLKWIHGEERYQLKLKLYQLG